VNDLHDARFDSDYHAPVMVREVCEQLLGARDQDDAPPQSPPRILDGTLGGGGHSAALLELGADVTGLDRDPNAIAEAGKRLAAFAADGRFRAVETNYAEPPSSPHLYDGILLDLGVSSHQFDDEARGFSFREGAPLDMRMGVRVQTDAASGSRVDTGTAADWLNYADESELSTAFREYADERKAGHLARQIIHRRASRPFATSDDLVGAIRAVHGPRSGPPEFARIFQAVRIAVNDEIGGLARALPVLRDRLAPSGVIAVITYHSGEDRLVKHTFREWSVSCTCPPRQPVCVCGGDNALGAVVTRKAIVAAADEILRNARARSAKLRAWRRRRSPRSGA
jgi:16S rRNA (cytosine1402-N4)-methyltransferase